MTIEEGGFGAESAAPAALQILEAYFHKHATESAGRQRGKPADDVRDPRPAGAARALRRPRRPRRAPRPRPHGLAADLRRRRPGRLQRLHARPGDQHDVPGSPHYYVDRQAIYGVARRRRDAGAEPDRLLALPRAAGRDLHLPLRHDRPGLRLRLRRPRLAALLRTSRFSASSHPSSASSCSFLALAGFVIDGARRGSPRSSARCAISASDWLRLRSSSCSRTSAPRLVLVVATLAVMYFGGVPWTHFAVIGGGIVALDRSRPRGGPRRRATPC